MTELTHNLSRFIDKLHEKEIRFRHIGTHQHLDRELSSKISEAEALTQTNRKATFNFLFNYGSRAEITDTVRKIVKKYPRTDEITDDTVSGELWTSGLPDVDILVRTGREKRLSNFMIWQCAFATIHFLDKYWPDLDRRDITHIVEGHRTEQG